MPTRSRRKRRSNGNGRRLKRCGGIPSLWRKRGGIEERAIDVYSAKARLCPGSSAELAGAESVYREALNISRQKGDEDPEALVDLERVFTSSRRRKIVEARDSTP